MNNSMSNVFVWIDLEMTGLSIEHDRILEIACAITSPDLALVEQSHNIVIKQPAEILQKMDSWNTLHHTQSGLLDDARNATITIEHAEESILQLIKKYCAPKTAPLCGNSIWVDRMFLRKYMPTLESYLHYRTIDVSSIKILAQQWYHTDTETVVQKKDIHRANADIVESIEELRYYRTTIFKQK